MKKITFKHFSKRDREKIQFIDDERSIGNSIIISLRDGFEFGLDTFESMHVQGFDSIADAVIGVRESIPCFCKSCNLRENS